MLENNALEELILGYCQQVDGIVEPPSFGAFEILLPDEIANRWHLAAHQRFAFSPGLENSAYIHFGHHLVETIVDELRTQTANGCFFINNVRPEKPKLYEVIEKAFSFSNAKMFSIPDARQSIGLHHYVRFNFKVNLIADEKRELILPVWMDAEGGFAVHRTEIERKALFDLENAFLSTSSAALLWTQEPLLTPNTLAGLLERARLSAPVELGDTLANLQKRLQRFLLLDRARLNDYYDDLRKDTARRLQKAEADRRPALEMKLIAIANERQSKLADVEQKYHLRIQLELINLAVIAQPKLDVWIEIRKRGVTTKRRATWDPLLHMVEGLVCDVCNRVGYSLVLCENGHLAHAECLAPQCVECKRTYCQKCAGEMQTCVVCDRPICVHSLHRCVECGRVTCQDHLSICHAAAGQPSRIIFEQPGNQEHAPQPVSGGGENLSTPKTKKTLPLKPNVKREAPASRILHTNTRSETAGGYLEVYSDPTNNLISASVMVKKREIASREWSMGDQGIEVNCWCQKLDCRERDKVYRPAAVEGLTAQIVDLVETFAAEYEVLPKKIHFFHIRQGRPYDETRLKVPASWKEPATLERAWAGFEALRIKNRS